MEKLFDKMLAAIDDPVALVLLFGNGIFLSIAIGLFRAWQKSNAQLIEVASSNNQFAREIGDMLFNLRQILSVVQSDQFSTLLRDRTPSMVRSEVGELSQR